MCSVSKTSSFSSSDDESELRRGPWTDKEDNILIHYISCHGEGHWNLLANRSGLKRTGRSCRFRWVNYLKPDVKRGNLTPEEQQLILHLHSKWGNRWSKIAQYLPGRTDNEIKNYWRTGVQKQARYLKNIDTKSREFFQEPFPFSPDLKSLQNPTFNLALIRKPPSYTSERPHTSVNNQLFSSSESAIFSKDPGLENMGCNFYYNQSNYTESFNVNYIHDMKTVNFSSGDSANTIAGDNDRVWNWDMDEFWK